MSNPTEKMTQRFAIGIEFCGTHFRGWQTQQDGVVSVQETLERVLSKVANHPVIVHAAGRTDAGVHASNMVAHFDTTAIRPERGWIMGANTQLPKDIAIRWLKPMGDDFHARFKACARRYRYVIYNHAYRPALLYGQVTHVYQKLNVDKMQRAVDKLLGIHDFSSFRAASCQSNQPVRNVSHAKLFQHGAFLILDIQADGFLHHMVRNIVGTLLEIGSTEKEPDWIDYLFEIKQRDQAGITAPPDGLYFIQAYYPEQFQLPQVDLGPSWLNLPD